MIDPRHHVDCLVVSHVRVGFLIASIKVKLLRVCRAIMRKHSLPPFLIVFELSLRLIRLMVDDHL